jgi:hypothetical protein
MSPARKIGYSFLGLLTGDVALLAYFVWITRAWEHNHLQSLDIFLLYVIFTFPGWVVVGIPAVLLISPQTIRTLRWLSLLIIGAALGAFAQLLIFLLLASRHDVNLAGHGNQLAWYFELSALVSTVAFAVYCALVRRTLRQQ